MRLNSRGDYCAPGSGLGVVTANGVPIDSSGSDACWLTDDVLLAQHCDQSCQIRRFDVKTGEIRTEDPAGANWLRAGGGVWRAWLNGHVRGSGGFGYDGYLCDVSDDGETVTAPPSFDSLTVWNGGTIRNIATGPLGNNATSGPNVRLRDRTLLWQGQDGWHVRSLLTMNDANIVPRTETIYFAVQVWEHDGVVMTELWLVEQSGRLTLRPYHSTQGYVITTDPVYGIDARYVNGKIRIVWASSPGEPPEHQHVFDQDLSKPRVELNAVEPPPENDMSIAYGQVMTGFTLGDLLKHPDGDPYLQVKKSNGKVLCVTPDGHVEERDSAGPWEKFEKRGNALVAQRDLNGKPVVYVLPLA